MSYLQLDLSPVADFGKVVLNIWARVPKESVAACKAAYKNDKKIPFDGIIPLVVMGKDGTQATKTNETTQEHIQISEVLAHMLDGPLSGVVRTNISWEPYLYVLGTPIAAHVVDKVEFNVPAPSWVDAPPDRGYADQVTISKSTDKPDPKNPSFIGVDCSGDKPRLVVNFETATKGKATNYQFNKALGMKPGGPIIQDPFYTGTITISYIFATLFIPPPESTVREGEVTPIYPPDGTSQIKKTTFTDISDYYLNSTGAIISDVIEFFGDHWHNIQVSLELKDVKTHGSAYGDPPAKSGTYVDSASRLHVAVDDVNYTKDKLSSYWPDGYSDDNGIISEDASGVIGTYPTLDDDGNSLGIPTYALTGLKVPVKDQAMGLPATTKYVKDIYQVEQGEFFMWTGVTNDTSVTNNRRIFINDKGEPELNKKLAEDLLGIPVIKLHGSGAWKTGHNTGSTGKDPATGEKILSGQFTPKAKNKAWKPKPSLNGPQFPKPKP